MVKKTSNVKKTICSSASGTIFSIIALLSNKELKNILILIVPSFVVLFNEFIYDSIVDCLNSNFKNWKFKHNKKKLEKEIGAIKDPKEKKALTRELQNSDVKRIRNEIKNLSNE